MCCIFLLTSSEIFLTVDVICVLIPYFILAFFSLGMVMFVCTKQMETGGKKLLDVAMDVKQGVFIKHLLTFDLIVSFHKTVLLARIVCFIFYKFTTYLLLFSSSNHLSLLASVE